MDSVGSKPDLFEQGTRYDHYVELKEVFLLGIDVIDRMNPNYVSDGDRAMKRELEITVKTINKRLDYLSGFAAQASPMSKLAREVDSAGISRQLLLTEGKPDAKQSQDSNHQNRPEAAGDPPTASK